MKTNPGKSLAELKKKKWDKHPELREQFRKGASTRTRQGLLSGHVKRDKNGRFQKVK